MDANFACLCENVNNFSKDGIFASDTFFRFFAPLLLTPQTPPVFFTLQYGIKVTPATIFDAPYVLDEILGNETELEILEQTSDTGGQIERIFGAYCR
jgi:hypothetical protein